MHIMRIPAILKNQVRNLIPNLNNIFHRKSKLYCLIPNGLANITELRPKINTTIANINSDSISTEGLWSEVILQVLGENSVPSS